MDWLLSRETVVALAVLGAIASLAASLLQSNGRIGAARARQLSATGYGFMAVSMLLFIVIGFRS